MRPKPGETVLDVGSGDGTFWSLFVPMAALREVRILSCDLRLVAGPRPGFIVADALRLPFRDKSIDILFSNSVLEHVGDTAAQIRYATEVRRVAKRYFVQVPNRDFPIEPHFLVPFMQYLPTHARRWVGKTVFGTAEEIHLPSYSTVCSLFPGATIQRERFWGLTKAFYVYGP
jgi:ubiquinone/menaquinone biosynthesis C-methylase UbiE